MIKMMWKLCEFATACILFLFLSSVLFCGLCFVLALVIAFIGLPWKTL